MYEFIIYLINDQEIVASYKGSSLKPRNPLQGHNVTPHFNVAPQRISFQTWTPTRQPVVCTLHRMTSYDHS